MEIDNSYAKDNLAKQSKTNSLYYPLPAQSENKSMLLSIDAPLSPAERFSPTKPLDKVRNPFEAALTDRLHLPLIASPSLFQRPGTPPMSSTHFEWTIEEVSSLKPANVEPHETQFQDSPNSDLEAKAQLAIHTYFKEQQIVPSPAECRLRSQRIILSEIHNLHTPICKPGRRIRDSSTQTELSLPAVLPESLEEALKPYFQPHLTGPNVEISFGRYNYYDTSLRRKLFDMHNIMLLENEENIDNTPKTPGRRVFKYLHSSPRNKLKQHVFAGKLSDSTDTSSFGSPFSSLGVFSPNYEEGCMRRDFPLINFLNETEEILSPIQPPEKEKALNCAEEIENGITKHMSAIENGNTDIFLPEKTSTTLSFVNNIAECSANNFNIKIRNLNMNNSETCITLLSDKRRTSLSDASEIKMNRELCPIAKGNVDTINRKNSNIAQDVGPFVDNSKRAIQNAETPRDKRRLATRKNLSYSFNSSDWLTKDSDEGQNQQQQKGKITTTFISNSLADVSHDIVDTYSPRKKFTIHRTGSGFNVLSNQNTFYSN